MLRIVRRSWPLEREGQINRMTTETERVRETTEIAFVTLAENGTIDEVTATEHMDAFERWEAGVDYKAGNLRTYGDGGGDSVKLYRCVQDHRSQADWTPDRTAALWAVAGDPKEEWPEWSQPIGAHDAYGKGDKVSHTGKRWTSDVDNNVWEPGVYGWKEEN